MLTAFANGPMKSFPCVGVGSMNVVDDRWPAFSLDETFNLYLNTPLFSPEQFIPLSTVGLAASYSIVHFGTPFDHLASAAYSPLANSLEAIAFPPTALLQHSTAPENVLWLIKCAEAGLVRDGDVLRERLAANISAWHLDPTDVSQRDLWRVINALAIRPSVCISFKTSMSGIWREQKWFENLSSRQVRDILGVLLERLATPKYAISARQLVCLVHITLSSEIAARVRLSGTASRTGRGRWRAPSTHAWTLTFVLHTGISPPTAAPLMRPADGRALVSITNAQENVDETVPRRTNKTDLLHPLRRRRATTCLRGGSRINASTGRRLQSAGCCHFGSHHRLEA
jgi:hypothetical protein